MLAHTHNVPNHCVDRIRYRTTTKVSLPGGGGVMVMIMITSVPKHVAAGY